jgi:hypothetical protein
MEAEDDDEGNGEEVEESGMFQAQFTGHCNISSCREVPPLCLALLCCLWQVSAARTAQ